MEADSKTYEHCILALKKKTVDIEGNRKRKLPLRNVAALKQDLSPDEIEQLQQDVRYLCKEL